MGELIQQMRRQLNEFWKNLEKGKKIKLVIGILILLISLTLMIFFLTRTKYEVLFSGLTSKDAALVTKKLDDMNVKWKDEYNGTTILVPKNDKNRLKMELIREGIPRGRYSREDAFNDSSWTMTEYDKKQRASYALENDLANDIEKIEGIEEASVFLNLPENTSYVLNNNEEPSASVFIILSVGRTLSSIQVQGIQDYVASAVGMNPDNVSVIDDTGRVLTISTENKENFDLTEQLNLQQGLQERINKSIRSFLESVFGYGNVVVRAGVKMNFDSELRSEIEFKPPIQDMEEGLVRSMEKIEEHMENMFTGGVPGVDSNVEDVTDYVQQEGESSRYDKASETINYELNEINKQIKKAPGQVESVTVAIILDKNSLPEGELTDDLRAEISSLIYAATGLDTKQVEISALPFIEQIDQYGPTEDIRAKFPAWLIALIAIGVISVASIIIVMFRRKERDIDINEMIEQKASEMSVIEDIDFDSEKSKVKEQINNFVDKKPEAVAQLLRTWLNEE
ncbi:flagellar M-ring protein FliF [Proteiniborus ethanoligenes]|uniref:Flagellar M-ring protein n=1 Tax=Proteiniborus ethanoligenes TaxID=415015 RepID=A0A1H3PNH0_9FIRM|nr:flagellar basal-body MS-ring/collar protein FliF [Proteiniborus ethanoligenes]SDZ02704.1 flagellar M-ring protein FliF [Proteiniborus ethanoligenes]